MRSTLVKISAGMVLPMLALIGAYVVSPYVAVHNFIGIAQSGDVDQIDAAVDFPRVRESLKAEFNASLVAHMHSDPAMKDNPFAGLSMMMGPAMIDRMVDAVITPEGIASMVRSGQMKKESDGAAPSNPDVKVTSSYVTLDRFKTVVTSKADTGAPITLTFERQGLFGWRLIRVELPLPAEATAAPAATIVSPASPAEDTLDNTLGAAADQRESGSEQLAVTQEPGQGDDMPRYDEAAYCRKIGETAGGSNVIERSCAEQEQSARSEAERMSIPARTVHYCSNIGRVAGGSYVIFKSCVDQEMAAAAP